MIETIFGNGKDLDTLQMVARAAVLFFVALVLVRIGGMRAFGRKSSFDTVIAIMLGAVLSRAVVGASAVLPTVAAAATLVVVHRVLAMATSRFPALERFVKGGHHHLYRDGEYNRAAMLRAGISEADLEQAVRRALHQQTMHRVAQIELESDGHLSVIERR